jgi:hypothetical protein
VVDTTGDKGRDVRRRGKSEDEGGFIPVVDTTGTRELEDEGNNGEARPRG